MSNSVLVGSFCQRTSLETVHLIPYYSNHLHIHPDVFHKYHREDHTSNTLRQSEEYQIYQDQDSIWNKYAREILCLRVLRRLRCFLCIFIVWIHLFQVPSTLRTCKANTDLYWPGQLLDVGYKLYLYRHLSCRLGQSCYWRHLLNNHKLVVYSRLRRESFD
jgi:hypothetical protein